MKNFGIYQWKRREKKKEIVELKLPILLRKPLKINNLAKSYQ